MRSLTKALAIVLAFATALAFVYNSWAVQAVSIAVFGIAALLGGQLLIKPQLVHLPRRAWAGCALVIAISIWPLIQLLINSTVSRISTLTVGLHWATLAGIFLLAVWVGTESSNRLWLLEFLAIFTTAIAVLCLAQLFTSEGSILWLIPSGSRFVYGTFVYYNHYAEFVEVGLPVVVWLAFTHPQRMLAYVLSAAVIYASVIACASRSGTIMCTAEIVFLMIWGFRKSAQSEDAEPLSRGSSIAQKARTAAANQQLAPLPFGGAPNTESLSRGSSIAQGAWMRGADREREPLSFGGTLNTEPGLRGASKAQRARMRDADQGQGPSPFGGAPDSEPGLRGASVEFHRFDWKRSAGLFAILPVATLVFTLLAGWQHVWTRFHMSDPYGDRLKFAQSTLQMALEKPLLGYGIGTFPLIYPQHASFDVGFGRFLAHAHNDWVEVAAEGGAGFLACIVMLFALRIPAAIKSGWGIGVVALAIHAYIDYPFPAIGVSGWIFAVLGLLYSVD